MRLLSHSVALSAALIFGISGVAVLAQDQPAAGAPPPAATSQAPSPDAQPNAAPNSAPNAPNSAPNPQRQAKTLARRLALNPQQQSEVESILADREQLKQERRMNQQTRKQQQTNAPATANNT